jgi:FkbM family methyltransferase
MRNEDRKFYFAQNKNKSTGSSLYKENSNVLFDEKTIPVKKLSDVVPDQNYDLIKLDVQGAELEIIEGSLDLFKKTKWVQLECPVYDNNERLLDLLII